LGGLAVSLSGTGILATSHRDDGEREPLAGGDEYDALTRFRRRIRLRRDGADEVAKRLEKHGFKETEASIANKLARGTFATTFFLACLAALELEGVKLEDL
jgi:hypothetical protein